MELIFDRTIIRKKKEKKSLIKLSHQISCLSITVSLLRHLRLSFAFDLKEKKHTHIKTIPMIFFPLHLATNNLRRNSRPIHGDYY